MKAPASAYALTVVAGAALAAAFGAAAALFREGSQMLSFGVFATMALGPCLSLSWLAFVSQHTALSDRHAEENVETAWFTRATSGACTDTFAACGIALAAVTLADLDVSASAALSGVLALVVLDTAVRYLVEKRWSR
ncbi:hypothetical protein [Streptomyces synnematoformans]|uniref:Uncharacterized protein n=1 Tax=Streptomyces synnematoformans TaxID=415721 RepID=A0ABP5JLH3_9ACTN